jgi:phage baseplate assembly protein W
MSDYSAPTYPFVRNDGKKFTISTDEELIKQNIIQAILIPLGQRPMLKHKGSKLHTLLFINEDDIRNALSLQYVKDIVEEQEPNALIFDVVIENNNDEIYAYITYGIAGSNFRDVLKTQIGV